jgi:hypothetical protein
MKQGTIITGADLINRTRIQVDEDRTRHVLSGTSLGEDGVELAGVVERGCVGVGTAILLETVLEEVAVGALLVRV